MPKNPDLVPTVIVDVNGRTTVVHKLRKLLGGAATRIPSPAKIPTGSLPGEGASTPAGAVKSLMRMLPVPADKAVARELSDSLSSHFSVESLNWFAGVLAEGGPLAEGAGKHLASTRFADGEEGQTEAADLEAEVRSIAAFFPLLGVEDYAEVRGMVWSLRLTPRFAEARDFAAWTEDQRERCAATMIAASEVAMRYPAPLHEEGYPVFTHSRRTGGKGSVLNEPLFSFVFDNHDERAEIVDAVVESKSMDPEMLRGVMGGITLSLADGGL
jgi:hypothetical protein